MRFKIVYYHQQTIINSRSSRKYSIYGKSPLVFITTDTKSKHLNAAFNLFPDSICSQFQIHQISLNAISSTLLKKALKSVCTMMSDMKYSNLFRIPDQDVIDSIILASHGDIRSAVLNLYVASLKSNRVIDRISFLHFN